MRLVNNPLIKTEDIRPSRSGLVVECVLNPGAFRFQDKIWLILRVAERPVQEARITSFPIINQYGEMEILAFSNEDPDLDLSDARLVKYKGATYLSTISHLRLMYSEDGIHFFEPEDIPSIIFGAGEMETFGIEDCRVTQIGDDYILTYTQVSEKGVCVGMMKTRDWQSFERHGTILPPHNKDCCIFDQRIAGKYFCLHRPSGIDLGGNFIWAASSPDLIHWGNHHCILQTRPGYWDSVRVGAGAAPILTKEGWLEIYHGADEHHRYCLGAVLLDIDDPTIVLARSAEPIFAPDAPYEQTGFFGNVVFTNGHIIDGDKLLMYYGASDEVICGAFLSINEILQSLTPEHSVAQVN